MPTIKKLLALNRGEIAIRILRAANELKIRTVAVYSDEDRLSLHRFKADEAYLIGEGKGPVQAYLDVDGIAALAKERGVDAIHPGYGFLSENPALPRACEVMGITFIGPSADLLDLLGDKTAARKLAQKAGLPVIPGTEEPVTQKDDAQAIADKIGYPLMVKAAFGGGGRGMRVVPNAQALQAGLQEARAEAGASFGNDAVFLERYIRRARHCNAAVALARESKYYSAATVEFLVDADTGEWYFIEVNPRVQVEHTVTEMVTGIDIVQSQIQIAQGFQLHGPEMDLPHQKDISLHGYALQCRVTTEDPANGFLPDYGKIQTYRSPAGFGIRLDGASAYGGAVITPYYDSLLVKVTAWGREFPQACRRMDRCLREFRIRGVKTNIPFLVNVVNHERFQAGGVTTSFLAETPELFQFAPLKDRATRLLNYLGEVIVNGNPEVAGKPRPASIRPAPIPDHIPAKPPEGTKHLLETLGPEKFAEWTRSQKRLLITDTTFRDAHQSLMATRVRTYDMAAISNFVAHRLSNLYSLEMWGGATFDVALRFLLEDPWTRLRVLREAIPNVCFQMLFRASNGVGYSAYPDNAVEAFILESAAQGIDIFRVFDALNWLPNMKQSIESIRKTNKVCEASICYTGDILDPRREKYPLQYYVRLGKELEKMGAHILCIKDMAGVCRPYAAERLFTVLSQEVGLPLHFHTHDTSGLNAASILKAAEAGVHAADGAIASMSGTTSQPNLNSVVAALQHTERDTGLDLEALNLCADYWETVRTWYRPFDNAPPAGTAEVYIHEMPGGQYTNLREQAESMGLGARWQELAHTYAEVNFAFGDIVKVTPSSKVVGDMAIFLVSHDMTVKDLERLGPDHNLTLPNSVVEMFAGALGEPEGGWPPKLQSVILRGAKPQTGRPGENLAPVDFPKVRSDVESKIQQRISGTDLMSYLMYPDVFLKFSRARTAYGELESLPTPQFFYGLDRGQEIAVELEPGKTLVVKLLTVSDPHPDGTRTIFFELNGQPREAEVRDNALRATVPSRPKADPAEPGQVGSPIPGAISSIVVELGEQVKKGDRLLILEAMKMQSTVYAPIDGKVTKKLAGVGDKVEAKDLLLVIE
ncbi:MAG: pyruvate carboxylase [Acidobacteriia bacterium]|nr:pyruvate carboxylase [Terriglobia bacterium]